MAVKLDGDYKEVFTNLDINLVAVTDDKLYNILNHHLGIASKQNDWEGLAGILVTIVIALITCKFDDILGITNSGIFLFAFFVLSALLILFYLAKSLYHRETTDADKMLAEIKKNKAKS